jgi:YfiH family protein
VTVTDPPCAIPVADAAVTTTSGLALAVVTADCAPVVLASDDAVAVAHAGHRGLLAGVLEATVAALRAAGRGEVRGFLGPCIRPARYEFASRDLVPLVEHFGPTVATSTHDGRRAFDIPEAVRLALAGVGVDQLHDVGTCTAGSPAHFSYRRDGRTGRQDTIVMLVS